MSRSGRSTDSRGRPCSRSAAPNRTSSFASSRRLSCPLGYVAAGVPGRPDLGLRPPLAALRAFRQPQPPPAVDFGIHCSGRPGSDRRQRFGILFSFRAAPPSSSSRFAPSPAGSLCLGHPPPPHLNPAGLWFAAAAAPVVFGVLCRPSTTTRRGHCWWPVSSAWMPP
jgi:hypothetical protein